MVRFANIYTLLNKYGSLKSSLKTAFHMKWGTFSYRRMSFVLINVRATFQRAMDIEIWGLVGHYVVIYLDDVSIFSKKREHHVFHLKHNFDRCRKYGIPLNPKKIIFYVLEGKPLGHVISKKGISIDPERFEDITQIPMPHNKKDMQSFMGTINFVQIFVPNLRNLCSKWWSKVYNSSGLTLRKFPFYISKQQ